MSHIDHARAERRRRTVRTTVYLTVLAASIVALVWAIATSGSTS